MCSKVKCSFRRIFSSVFAVAISMMTKTYIKPATRMNLFYIWHTLIQTGMNKRIPSPRKHMYNLCKKRLYLRLRNEPLCTTLVGSCLGFVIFLHCNNACMAYGSAFEFQDLPFSLFLSISFSPGSPLFCVFTNVQTVIASTYLFVEFLHDLIIYLCCVYNIEHV